MTTKRVTCYIKYESSLSDEMPRTSVGGRSRQMAAFAASPPQESLPCMHAARSCSAAQILRAGNPARRICKPWRVAWHVASDNGPARLVTIRYSIIREPPACTPPPVKLRRSRVAAQHGSIFRSIFRKIISTSFWPDSTVAANWKHSSQKLPAMLERVCSWWEGLGTYGASPSRIGWPCMALLGNTRMTLYDQKRREAGRPV